MGPDTASAWSNPVPTRIQRRKLKQDESRRISTKPSNTLLHWSVLCLSFGLTISFPSRKQRKSSAARKEQSRTCSGEPFENFKKSYPFTERNSVWRPSNELLSETPGEFPGSSVRRTRTSPSRSVRRESVGFP